MSVAEPALQRVVQSDQSPLRQRAAAIVLAAAFFAAIAPTLRWMEFASGVENLNVSTVLEMRRGGPWLIPTLDGQQRIRKPPLTAWVSATFARPQTVAQLSDRDPAVRDRAAANLAWQVRAPALASMTLWLLAVYELGRVILGHRGGLVSLAIAGTTFCFLRFSRLATTDVVLTCWVGIASTCLAHAILRGRYACGLLAAGAGLGVAIMAKGPVALVQTLLPFAAYMLWSRRAVGAQGSDTAGAAGRSWPWAAAGLAVMVVLGGWWFVVVLAQRAGAAGLWMMEVTRSDEVERATSDWYDYAGFIGLMMPWTPLFVGGAVIATRAMLRPKARSSSQRRLVLALVLVVLPVLVMSFFRDRKLRYLLPLTGPAAVLAAACAAEFVRKMRATPTDRLLYWVHVCIITIVGIAFPILAMAGWPGSLRTQSGESWLSASEALPSAAACALLIAAVIATRRRWRFGVIAATVLVMLVGQAIFMVGYTRTYEGRSEMRPLAERIWADYPNAAVYNVVEVGKRIPPDLSIYLNRVIPWVQRLDEIPPEPRPQIYVQRWQGEGQPPEPHVGWTQYTMVPRDVQWWVAYLRSPAEQRVIGPQQHREPATGQSGGDDHQRAH